LKVFLHSACTFNTSIDATNVDGLCKMVNDAPTYVANAIMKRHVSKKASNKTVHICLFAACDIPPCTELRLVIVGYLFLYNIITKTFFELGRAHKKAIYN